MLFCRAMAEPLRGQLLVVGTPIGNLEDLSPRALRALSDADAILCEDTRVTGKLAARFGLAPRASPAPAPREKGRVAELLRRLEKGETVALVSDAGMPGLSDPGEHLVAAAAEAGYPVRVVPGPSASVAALAISGTLRRASPLPRAFSRRAPGAPALPRGRPGPGGDPRLVRGASPSPRIARRGRARARAAPACVARELTKVHEEAARGTLPALAAEFRLAGRGARRGDRRRRGEPGGTGGDARPRRSTARSSGRSPAGRRSGRSPARSPRVGPAGAGDLRAGGRARPAGRRRGASDDRGGPRSRSRG